MKQFNMKILSSLLIAVSTLSISFLTANAQVTESIVPLDKQWVSIVSYDGLGLMDSATYTWSKQGFPVVKEFYNWFEGKRYLSGTGAIISDADNVLISEHTSFSQEGDIDGIMHEKITFNDSGDILQDETSISMEGMPDMVIKSVVNQYWKGANNRLDSVLTTSNSYGSITKQMTKFSGWDADGRSTVSEGYDYSDGSYWQQKTTYYKNASGKIERDVSDMYMYESANDLSNYVISSREINYYDAQERILRHETYNQEGSGFASQYSLCEVYQYDGETGIVNPWLPAQMVIVNVIDGCLSVNSSKAEKVEIYSVSGAQVYANTKPAGEIQISMNHIPKGIYLIKGSSGWVKKITR